MTLRVGKHTFRYASYDASSDVLYAAVEGPPYGSREPTPEQHVWRFDDEGHFVGITFVNPREQLEREGAVFVTLPTGERERVAGAERLMRSAG
ncbi:MAG: hypothetical protein QOJ01_28 [Solirubrobacterales bacterium]|nr:hypothetical protein [Solirubrobacterales bacterium]